MSDRMQPVSFSDLLNWINSEWKLNGSIFACNKVYYADRDKKEAFLGRYLETPVGPAAGPHTQLAQNIVAAYVCGGRFFELKTVQILDGEDLVVSKPCIFAEDEGYNCEWSTELTVGQAFEEYVKAWVLLHYLAKEYGMGDPDGFVFNMSVGYDLEGIKSAKIDGFIEGMKDASGTEVFAGCKEVLKQNLSSFSKFAEEDIDAISPNICQSVTMSTMHGCPSGEIEKIASYLIEEKNLDLYLKCNPTLAGYDYVRSAFDELGFSRIQFEHESFDNDLKYEEAVPMLRRLRERASALGQFFGVKLTNTFPVKQLRGELPDDTMYMSGRTLLPVSLKVAQKIAEEFGGDIPVSYCGGAGAQNIQDILSTGMYPVTVCTDLLKPGGYHRLNSITNNAMLEETVRPDHIDSTVLGELAATLCGHAGIEKPVRRKPLSETGEGAVNCRNVCGNCATLCPNRANIVVIAGGRRQMLHIDGFCNECGNCASFCPEKTAPYLEKLTLFVSEDSMKDSRNIGFAPIDEKRTRFLVRTADGIFYYDTGRNQTVIPAEISEVIDAVVTQYPYLMYR